MKVEMDLALSDAMEIIANRARDYTTPRPKREDINRLSFQSYFDDVIARQAPAIHHHYTPWPYNEDEYHLENILGNVTSDSEHVNLPDDEQQWRSADLIKSNWGGGWTMQSHLHLVNVVQAMLKGFNKLEYGGPHITLVHNDAIDILRSAVYLSMEEIVNMMKMRIERRLCS